MLPFSLPPSPQPQACLFDLVRELGIHHIFGVPGTPGRPLRDGTYYPESDVTYIEYPHESLALRAALGTASITGLPGVVVVHPTPDVAHRLHALLGAARSRLPLVIICCQLRPAELAPATSLVALARPYTKWAYEVEAAADVPQVLGYAFREAAALPSGPVFVAIPGGFTLPCLDTRRPAASEAARVPPPADRPAPGTPPAQLASRHETSSWLGHPKPAAPAAPSYLSIFPGNDYAWQTASRLPSSRVARPAPAELRPLVRWMKLPPGR